MIEENKKCPFLATCNHLDCDTFCIKNFKTAFYFEEALIPENKRIKFPLYIDKDGRDSDAFSYLTSLEKDIINFVESGNNLYLFSENPGNGKTSWTFRLARSYIEASWFKKELTPIVLFISVPKFLLELKANIEKKSSYIEHILSYVKTCDLVIWDDIGSKAGTEFEISYLLSIIDERLLNKKSNIYTSNLNKDELHNLLGDRVYSRVYNYSTCVEFFGKDKRSVNTN